MKSNQTIFWQHLKAARDTKFKKNGGGELGYWEKVETIWEAISAYMNSYGINDYGNIPADLHALILKSFYWARYKMTQEKFARRIRGCSQPKVSRILNGKASLRPDEFVEWLFAFGQRGYRSQ